MAKNNKKKAGLSMYEEDAFFFKSAMKDPETRKLIERDIQRGVIDDNGKAWLESITGERINVKKNRKK